MLMTWLFIICGPYMERTNFAKISKNLDTDPEIILLDHQNNYIRNSNMNESNTSINFDILAFCLSILRNYFDNPRTFILRLVFS